MKYSSNFNSNRSKLNKNIQDYICEYRYENFIEKIDTIMYKLKSIQEYYKIKDKEIERVMKYKVDRQLGRIENGK